MIPYGRQDIQQSDIDAVIEVLNSNFLTQGPKVTEFEKAVAHYCHTKYGVAVNSATSALHIACMALDLGTSDWLWTTPITFVASANCALYCNAQVDFVDIDPITYNISIAALEAKLEQAQIDNQLPKIVIPVHLAGQSCDMQKIYELSQRYGFKIIEDASHAIGGSYQNKKIGSCQYSDITVFSFHPVKIITTGEGGMAMTNDPKIAAKFMLLRSHGITRDKSLINHDNEPWYYEQHELGYNYRMTDIAAALGASQLTRLDEYVAQRHAIAHRYNEALADLPLTLPYQADVSHSSYHLYIIRLNLQEIELSRLEVFNQLRDAGISVNVHYIPVHTQPYYKDNFGFQKGDFVNSEKYYAEAISLPMYPTLKDSEQDYIIEQIKRILD